MLVMSHCTLVISSYLVQIHFFVISGAGSGIGRAVCQTFVREGARLAAVDLHEKGLAPVLSLPGKIASNFQRYICMSLSFCACVERNGYKIAIILSKS